MKVSSIPTAQKKSSSIASRLEYWNGIGACVFSPSDKFRGPTIRCRLRPDPDMREQETWSLSAGDPDRFVLGMRLLKPPRLKKGDVIGLISPASTPAPREKIEKSIRYLEGLGYRVEVGPNAEAQH